jgi:hypothetical protein
VGPETGTAAADSSATSSVSSHATSDRAARAEARRDARKATREERHRTSRDTGRKRDADEPDDAKSAARRVTVSETARSSTAPTQTSVPVETAVAAPNPTPEPTREQRVAETIAAMSASAQAWIDTRPVSDARKERLEQVWSTMRRSVLNQAPTVNPVQVSGVVDGPVTGTVGAADPDGDRMVYRLVKGPATGTVRLNRDGSYTYTPVEGFNGVDTFVVRARDLGLHVNVLDLFRPIATSAGALINQGAITFDFRYGKGEEYWTADRRAALQHVADMLTEYLRVTAPVMLSYRVEGANESAVKWLAGANSQPISEDPGFWPTVIQNKLLTGADSNGEDADGFIEWNFALPYALGDVVGPDDYDFTSVGLHELLHSLGFFSALEDPEDTTGQAWTVFDRFLTSADGTRLVAADYTWPDSSTPYMTGGSNGLYFGGANAVAAYGKPVPLYSPSTWEPGSSGSHLDDGSFAGDDSKLMNHRIKGKGVQGVRTLSPLEIGILRDLGYTVVPPSQTLVPGVTA